MKKEKTSEAQKVTANEITEVDSSTDNSSTTSEKIKKKHIPLVSASSRFGIVTIILATMGIIISIDSLIKVKEWNTGLKTFKDQIEKHIETEHRRLNNLEASLQNISTRQKIFDKELNEYHTTLSSLGTLLQKRSQQQASVDILWQLEKVYDWLQEAKLDLRWSDDSHSALVLLQSADAVIEQINIPELAPIHSLLEENIKTLSSIQPINEVAILEKIKAMSAAVDTLPSPSSNASAKVNSQTSESQHVSGWRSMVNRGFEWIQNIVVIKPVNSVSSLPHFQSRRLLNENLLIALQQAQWALLKKDDVLFHWSLEQLSQMIQNSGLLIDLNSNQTTMFLLNLSFLEKQNLNPPTLPDLQPACQQLKAYMDILNLHLTNKVKA